MAAKYPYLDYAQVQRWIPEMKKLGVSVRARSNGQFIDQYRKAGTFSRLPERWRRKRDAFVARHLVQYNAKPTHRRWLALVAWAYMP